MSNNLPAETLQINPESLELANAYLVKPDIVGVADDFELTPEYVTQTLAKKEVRDYINNVFFNVGYNNRFKLRQALDAIIAKKFQDMDEAQVGSSKDIVDILAISHKITMEQLDKEIELEKLRTSAPRVQINTQINSGGTNYSSLIEKLIKSPDV